MDNWQWVILCFGFAALGLIVMQLGAILTELQAIKSELSRR